MSEERHVSCIEASDSPCTPETCEELICWVCEEPDPSWPCPSRRAQDAEAAIARVREVPASQIVGSDGHVRDMLLRADVLRALDDSEDALVQGAITAMLSEDAPLVDPCRDGKHSSCVGGPCQCPCHELAAP